MKTSIRAHSRRRAFLRARPRCRRWASPRASTSSRHRRRQRADGERLQGAGLRVHVRRQRRQQHGHSARRRRLRAVCRRCARRHPASTSRRLAAADPADRPRHAVRPASGAPADCRRCSTRSKAAILANVGTLLRRRRRRNTRPGCGRCRCIRTPTSRRNGKAQSRATPREPAGAVASPTRWRRSTRRPAFRSSPRSTAPCCSPPARRAFPLTIPATGSFALAGYNGTSAANARLAAVEQLLAAAPATRSSTGANAIGAQALQLSATVNPILANANSTDRAAVHEPDTNTAKQLYQVAKLIEARATTGAGARFSSSSSAASTRTATS